MIQCVVCEDWFHSRHLEAVVPESGDFSEMICSSCMSKHPFLYSYSNYLSKNGENSAVDVTSTQSENKEEGGNKTEGESEPEAKKLKLEDGKCSKPEESPASLKGSTFWPSDWRQQLCKCESCLAVYKEQKVDFLTDQGDTVLSYEEEGKKAGKETDYERGMRELSSLDRTKQIDAITAYNKMKDRLKEYLNQFVRNQQVVTEADVKRFFQEMKNEDEEEKKALRDQYYA